MLIKFAKCRDVKSPSRGHVTDAGIDLFIPEKTTFEMDGLTFNFDSNIVIQPNESMLIKSGIKFEIPFGFCGILKNKSSIASKMNLFIGATVIDSFYNGEVHIDLHNVGKKAQVLKPGMKIAQMLILPVVCAEPIEEKEEELYKNMKKISDNFRDSGGFGSTGH